MGYSYQSCEILNQDRDQDLFDSFFSDFDKKTSDYYSLKRLDPGYRIFFNKDEHFDVVEDYEKLKKELNQIESGAAESLD